MKRLIIACDGTWNRADQEANGVPCPTNVIRLAYRVAKRDGAIRQVIYYHQGVGSGNVCDKFSGGAFGRGLEENIHDAYRFLVANYEVGDEIYLFGFSRGAYTARSLAGMIRKCGILKREAVAKYTAAIALYRNESHPDQPECVDFRDGCSVHTETPIHFVGVWDTVGALGIPVRGLNKVTRSKYEFHDTELSGSVRFGYQALAIDEHRAAFRPALWRYKPKPKQSVEQAWFAGAHSDIGGGYADRALSDITLEWMINKSAAAGLKFDDEVRAAYPIQPGHLGKLHNSKTWMYWLSPDINRTIGVSTFKDENTNQEKEKPDPTQTVHESALKRRTELSDYDPEPLRKLLPQVAAPTSPAAQAQKPNSTQDKTKSRSKEGW